MSAIAESLPFSCGSQLGAVWRIWIVCTEGFSSDGSGTDAAGTALGMVSLCHALETCLHIRPCMLQDGVRIRPVEAVQHAYHLHILNTPKVKHALVPSDMCCGREPQIVSFAAGHVPPSLRHVTCRDIVIVGDRPHVTACINNHATQSDPSRRRCCPRLSSRIGSCSTAGMQL